MVYLPRPWFAFINSVCTRRGLLFAHTHFTQQHMTENKHTSEVKESPRVPTVGWVTTLALQIIFSSAKWNSIDQCECMRWSIIRVFQTQIGKYKSSWDPVWCICFVVISCKKSLTTKFLLTYLRYSRANFNTLTEYPSCAMGCTRNCSVLR